MKKSVKWLVIIIVALGVIYIAFFRYLPPYTPIKTARLLSGLKIPKDITVEKDTTFFSFTGEGYSEIVFILNENQFKDFEERNDLREFNTLPVFEKLPATLPEYYYDYMEAGALNKYYFEKRDTSVVRSKGYYYLEEHKKNESYRLTVVDRIERKILLYSFYD